jgi:rhamnosyltransferase subunit B
MGDVHPVIALGRALRARGHRVALATNEHFEAAAAANGLEFVALGTRRDYDELSADPRLWHPRRGLNCILERAVVPTVAPMYRIVEERRGPGFVAAATTLCLGARVAQERLGVPFASLHLQPTVMRSIVDGGLLGPFDFGPGSSALKKRAVLWLADTLVVDRLVAPPLNAFRAGLGLGPVRGIFRDYVHSPQLVLGLFPDWFAPAQPDWPANTHLTGFLMHDEGGSPQEAEAADAFLDGGPAPVLVTPGSAAMDRAAFFRRTARACSALGLRAMLVTNHGEQLPRRLADGARAFAYLPFSRVMPRCAAVAHHGGIGTLAQCVRAGVPQLIVANGFDQPDNGRRAARLGLGLSVGQLRYAAGGAAAALAAVTGSPGMRGRCADYSRRIDVQASLARACSLIEGLA